MTDVRRARREAAARWFVLLGGMTAFALYLLLAFYLVPFSCLLGSRLPLVLVTLVLAVVAALAIAMGWQRRDGTEAEGEIERPEWRPGRGARAHRTRFMIHAGIVLNVLGLLVILYGGATILAFDPCVNWQI